MADFSREPARALTSNVELSLTQLKRQVEAKSPVFDWAIGWLSRQDKIVITRENALLVSA